MMYFIIHFTSFTEDKNDSNKTGVLGRGKYSDVLTEALLHGRVVGGAPLRLTTG